MIIPGFLTCSPGSLKGKTPAADWIRLTYLYTDSLIDHNNHTSGRKEPGPCLLEHKASALRRKGSGNRTGSGLSVLYLWRQALRYRYRCWQPCSMSLSHYFIFSAIASMQSPTVIIFSAESKSISILYFASASIMMSTRLAELIFKSLTRLVLSSIFFNNFLIFCVRYKYLLKFFQDCSSIHFSYILKKLNTH
jgi:hypothetical protein